MRILLLTVDFPPAPGGIQNLLARIADGFAARHDVTVVAPHVAGDVEWDRASRHHVTRAPKAQFWPLVMLSFWCAALLAALRRPPDVIVCGHVLLGPVCWGISRMFGVPIVALAYAYEIRAPRMRALAGWTLRRAAIVVGVSDFTRRSVLAYGVSPDRVVVVNPGAAFAPTSEERRVGEEVRSEPEVVGAARGEKVILTVARLGELYKGHDMMIRALPLILAREPRARYVIVGDGPLRRYLERLATSVGVRTAVTFAGEVSDAELNHWYRRADLFALLSRDSPIDGGAEGYGLTFIEAGAWGKPVIGGNSGGIPDAVLDGVTGLLVTPTDLAAIAETVLRVLGDPALAARLGNQGQRRALEDLSWTNIATAFETVLTRATGTPTRAPDRPVGVRSDAS